MAEPEQPGRAVLALDAEDGRLLWRKEVEPPSATTDPVLVDGVAVVVSSGPMTAYDARSGDRLWSLEDVGPFPPQVAGDLLVLDRGGSVQAVAPRTGRGLWHRDVGREVRVFAGAGGVALVSDGPGGGGTVRLLDLDGRERWSTGLSDAPFCASPGRDAVVVGDLRGGVSVLDPVDGAVRWRAPSAPVDDV
ncbi:MAG: pyrrolo-quinoline quinone, partial [Frankiales bacterium]|nr:pyrrolo-quinoline quinone [Frankiales bacterium]